MTYTASPTRKATVCDRCGSTAVRWVQNHGGKWYLQNVKSWTGTETYQERTYPNGPHYKTCETTRVRTLEHMREDADLFASQRANDATVRLHTRYFLVLDARKAAGVDLSTMDITAWFETLDAAKDRVRRASNAHWLPIYHQTADRWEAAHPAPVAH